jgi:hypothetical protein
MEDRRDDDGESSDGTGHRGSTAHRTPGDRRGREQDRQQGDGRASNRTYAPVTPAKAPTGWRRRMSRASALSASMALSQ